MNYYTVGGNFVFALNLMLPEGDRKDRPYYSGAGVGWGFKKRRLFPFAVYVGNHLTLKT